MFKKNSDGTYSFTNRFWVQAIILGLLIVAIAWKTQVTANRTEQLYRDTRAYALQTQDCLTQLIGTLKDRTSYNDQLASLDAQQRGVWTLLVVEMAQIDPTLRTPERDIKARAAMEKFFAANKSIDAAREELLDARAAKPYPDPTCGNTIPGDR